MRNRMTRIMMALMLFAVGFVATAGAQDPNCYYGEGYGATYEEACENARAALLSNIVITVEASSTGNVYQSVDASGNLEGKEEFKSLVKSFSSATTLHNVRYTTLKSSPDFLVKCSVNKEDVAKMYELRRDKVFDLVLSAQRAETRGNVANALRYLYQAYVLLQSLPYPSEIRERIDGEERILANWIPERMNEICSDVKFSVVSGADNIYDLLVTYKGEPAESVDYTYWTGRSTSPIMGAKDGKGELEFPDGVKPSDVKISIEYQYADEVHSDPQVAPLLASFNGQSVVRQNVKHINVADKSSQASKAEKLMYKSTMAAGEAAGVAEAVKKDTKSMEGSMSEILKAIQTKKYDAVAHLFTADGLQMFKGLLQYGNARLLEKPEKISYKFYPMKERMVCRSVPMSFSFAGGNRKFIEDVTFTFNADGLVESLAFSLGSEATKSVFSQGGDRWSDYTKMVIATFLENYKTAYALKRLDYINSIFDDDAVIIVGHVTKSAPRRQQGDFRTLELPREHVTYVRKSKEEYLKQLEKCFRSNEYVNIRFAENDIAKSGFGGETFGIQIKQDYFSSSYGDQGYLFLMVDFNNEDAPVITVRTWQPERQQDITPRLKKDDPDYGIYGLGIFN